MASVVLPIMNRYTIQGISIVDTPSSGSTSNMAQTKAIVISLPLLRIKSPARTMTKVMLIRISCALR
ncbi:hypothetical protein D3C87_1857100 [compost metagenome]